MLIEMLIVVAIIAILIAISIPLVGNALERAREATDAASGKLILSTSADAATKAGKYGQGTANAGQDPIARKDGYLTGCVTANGEVKMQWSNDTQPVPTLTSTKLMGG